MPANEAVVREVDARLRGLYPPTDLGNKPDPLDELVYILVSGKTAEGTYQATFERLKSRYPTWEDLLSGDDSELVALLAPAGLAAKKACWLRSTLAAIQDRFGELTLAPLHAMTNEEAEGLLTSLPGIGIKTARCILMYSLGREVFPVDAHTARLFARLEWSRHHRITDRVQDRMQALVPPELRYALHVNCVLHGRTTCTAARPRCEACVLLDLCPTGQRLTSLRRGPPLPAARAPESVS